MNTDRANPVRSPDPASVGREKPFCILVVDDDQGARELAAGILKRDGYRVDTATNGASALCALQKGHYDLLVTGYIMPGTSGLALVRQLRVADLSLPVVMVSGRMETLDFAKLSHDPWSRIHAFVEKPVVAGELLSAVRSALAPKASQRDPAA